MQGAERGHLEVGAATCGQDQGRDRHGAAETDAAQDDGSLHHSRHLGVERLRGALDGYFDGVGLVLRPAHRLEVLRELMD